MRGVNRIAVVALQVSVVLFSLSTSLRAAMPEWYTSVPSDTAFFYGLGCSQVVDGNRADAMGKAKEVAVRSACASVFSSVSGQTIQQMQEDSKELIETFVSKTTIITAVEAVNVTVLKQDADAKMAYVMVAIPKADLRNAYRLRVENGMEKVASDFELAESLAKDDPRKAIRKYEACMAGLEGVKEDLALYLFLNDWKKDIAEDPIRSVKPAEVEKRLTQLSGSLRKRPDELAAELLDQLLPESSGPGSFVIYPLEYMNSGFVSEFGHQLTELLGSEITRRTKWRRGNTTEKSLVVVRGRILPGEKGMYLALTMDGDGRSNSAQLFVPESTCESIGWEKIRPLDYEKAMGDKVALYKELKNSPVLQVELKTDKLSDGPIVYRYGERPRLAVKVSRGCYIRLMYIFSDGTKVLLLDNYRIADDMANEWQGLPVNWEVCEPPGVEQMIVHASVGEKMPPLNVKHHELPGGYYQDIVLDSVAAAVSRTRGGMSFKSEPILTEVVSQWTVFEK